MYVLGGLAVLEEIKIGLAFTSRMKILGELGQPHRYRGTLDFLVWLLVKPLPLTLPDTWLNNFLSSTVSFKAGTVGLCQGELHGGPRGPKMVL